MNDDKNNTDNNTISIRDWDVAAILAMLATVVAEALAQALADESLLEQLPPMLGPILLALAAAIRLRFGRPASSGLS